MCGPCSARARRKPAARNLPRPMRSVVRPAAAGRVHVRMHVRSAQESVVEVRTRAYGRCRPNQRISTTGPIPPPETGLEGGEMYTSMRTRTIVALVVVGAMVPAGTAIAGPGPSINGLVGSQQSTGQDGSGAQSSVNALVGADSEQSSSQPANPTTLTALVGAEPGSEPEPAREREHAQRAGRRGPAAEPARVLARGCRLRLGQRDRRRSDAVAVAHLGGLVARRWLRLDRRSVRSLGCVRPDGPDDRRRTIGDPSPPARRSVASLSRTPSGHRSRRSSSAGSSVRHLQQPASHEGGCSPGNATRCCGPCSSALGPPHRADRGDRAQVLDQLPVDGESALA